MEYVSKCCEAEVKDHLSIRYPKGDATRGKTNYYICQKCGKPCDVKSLSKKEVSIIKIDTGGTSKIDNRPTFLVKIPM